MNNTGKIYLAGAITSLNYAQATDWRIKVAEELFPLECLSPLRYKSYLSEEKVILDSYDQETYSALSTPRGILARDFYDATRCDLIFVNLLGTTRVSIGTMLEIAWAYGKRIPIIQVIEKTGNIHEHSMVNECVDFRVETLEEGIHIAKAILLVK